MVNIEDQDPEPRGGGFFQDADGRFYNPDADRTHRSVTRNGLSSGRGESRDGGENTDTAPGMTADALRTARIKDLGDVAVLVTELREAGHGGCADDLRDAESASAARIAYEVAEHVDMACGYPPEEMPALAIRLRDWADQHERISE